ncbi:glycosyltransferase family 4 protein [Jeotgalibacillus salarius]|uniref:Glycosyltransferase family 4 protein n=1 Tax=Jeotgalibacillus salarius TaxID=546023 RepID=A0A4Y8LLQ8_9BACL|nr:glycosyltransferase family 4 protein [Jeotgalibacillus salarius]TFE03982.1 glycosyltransferase family 4 protein [Jeotgalibacillus salarius]
MTKTITVITNMYPSEEHPTFGIFVKNQVEALKAEGYQVDVLAIKDPRGGKANALKKYGIWACKNLFYLVAKGKKTDVVHVHYVFPSGLFGILHKKLFKTKMIVTAHGGDIDKMARISPVTHRMTKNIIKNSDYTIAVGNKLYDTIVNEFEASENRMELLNMGVDSSVFKPHDRIKARENLQIPYDERALLFVGNIIEQKGVMDLIEAIDHLKKSGSFDQSTLYLIGANKNPAFFTLLQEEISKRKLDDVVRYVGTKNQKELAEWMSASDVFVLPSHIEGFGLVALEAMSCGTPVIASRTGGLPYLLDQQSGHLVEPKNAASLAEGIRTVLSDPSYREKLRENGFNRAAENDQKRVIQKLKQLYFPNGG